MPANGLSVALWDWAPEGATAAVVVLVHANGFHSRCWDVVVRQLPTSFRCLCVDVPGHGHSDTPPEGQVSWKGTAHTVLEALAEVGLRPDLVDVLAGHSLGGYICTVAAALSTVPFPALLLVDPVIKPAADYGRGSRPWATDFAIMTRRRKDQFLNSDELFQRFRERSPYNIWHIQTLRDYCDHALAPAGADGWCRLRCRPSVEATWYETGAGPEAEVSPELAVLAGRRQRATVLRGRPDSSDGFSGSTTDPELATRLGEGAQDALMEDAGHFIPMTHPMTVAEHLERLVTLRSNL